MEHLYNRSLTLSCRASTADEATKSVEAVLATDTPTEVPDKWSGATVLEILLPEGARLLPQLPLLAAHDRSNLDKVLGSVRNLRREPGRIVGRLHFADAENLPEARRAWNLVRQGHLTDVSVGYQVHAAANVPAGQTQTVAGRTFTAPRDRGLRVATDWEPKEASLVAIGADPNSKTREGTPSHATRNGPPAADPPRIEPLPPFFLPTHEERMKPDAPNPILSILAAGLKLRCGYDPIDRWAPPAVQARQACEADEGRHYRGDSLLQMIRTVGAQRGQSGNDRFLFERAISSGDLSAITAPALQAGLVKAFKDTTDTTRGWCLETDLLDFKGIPRPRLETDQLLALLPGQKAHHVEITAAVETSRVVRFAAQAVLDEQDVLNGQGDRILVEIARHLGQLAGRIRPDLVFSILLANAALDADGKALFHTDHGNLGSAALDAAGTALSAAVAAVGNQTENGLALNARGKYLLVPPALKTTAATLLAGMELASSEHENITLYTESRLGPAGVRNPVTGETHAGTATNWLLACAADNVPAVEVAYGPTGRLPVVESFPLTQGQWGIGFAVKYDVGAKALSHHGLYKSSGTG